MDSKRKHSSVTTGDSGNESLTVKEQQTTTSSSCGSRNGSAGGDSTENNYPPCPPLTEEVLLQHNRMAHKHVKHPAPDEFCAAKDNYRFKRSGSPPVNSVLHKHTKPSRDGVDGENFDFLNRNTSSGAKERQLPCRRLKLELPRETLTRRVDF